MTAHDPATDAAAVLLLAEICRRAALDAAGQLGDIGPTARPAVSAAARCWLTWARQELAPLADAGDVRGPRLDPEAANKLMAARPW